MKKPATGLALLFAAFLSFAFTKSISNSAATCGLYANTIVDPYKELILQIDALSGKNLAEIRSIIEARGGVVYKGYCEDFHIVMYLVNRDIHPDNTFLDKLTALSYTYVIKEGTITQVYSECGMAPVPNTETETETE